MWTKALPGDVDKATFVRNNYWCVQSWAAAANLIKEKMLRIPQTNSEVPK